jgi:signal transduction histidine kinase
MWTRLVAGAAAHDINNLAQGLFNLLSLASAPGATREALDRYAALARDGIKDLRRLGTNLRALAAAEGGSEPQRLDLLTVEAVSDLDPPPERRIDLSPLDARALVAGPAAAMRLAIQGVVRYSVAASAPAGSVSVSVSRDDATAAVVVAAPTAPAPRSSVEAELGALLAGAEREFGGDAGLVLAGAAAHLSGGRASAGPAPGGGLRFKLTFPSAQHGTDGTEDAEPKNASSS